MSEQLGARGMRPGRHIRTLYSRWVAGRPGLLITGNVMVDRRFAESHRNVALEPETDLRPFCDWAEVARESDVHLWVQLNHPGRQCPRHIHPHPPAPSAVDGVALMRAIKAFGTPRAMSADEIVALVERFGVVAARCREAGFTGVQLHGAHGYLASQFLSPLTNTRDDDWGGSLENRTRFLRATLAAMRNRCGADFPISVKLNSADFQRGGFDEDDSLRVLEWLHEDGIDLVEISGGNYESKAMFQLDDTSTGRREAYFLDFARRARAAVDIPLMVTGGFRSRTVMNDALADGALDVIGVARPFANDPDFADRLLSGELERAEQPTKWLGGFGTRAVSEAMLSVAQMGLISRGLDPGSRWAAAVAAARVLIPGR